MKKIILIVSLVLSAALAHAAINAQYTFEDNVPSFLSANGNASVELSADKFKDGKHSVKFSWNGPAELVFSNFSDIEASIDRLECDGVIDFEASKRALLDKHKPKEPLEVKKLLYKNGYET